MTDAYSCLCGRTLTLQPGIRLACCDEPPDDRSRQQSRLEEDDPPPMALLPHLTEDELHELHDAIVERMNTLARVRATQIMSPKLRAEIQRKGLTLQSLDTAVQEARSHLR